MIAKLLTLLIIVGHSACHQYADPRLTTELHHEQVQQTRPFDHQQSLIVNFNPRPTQFKVANHKSASPISYSANGLILPANNEVVANEFQTLQQRSSHSSPSLTSITSMNYNQRVSNLDTHQAASNEPIDAQHLSSELSHIRSDKKTNASGQTGPDTALSFSSEPIVHLNGAPNSHESIPVTNPESIEIPADLGSLDWLLNQQPQLQVQSQPQTQPKPTQESKNQQEGTHQTNYYAPMGFELRENQPANQSNWTSASVGESNEEKVFQNQALGQNINTIEKQRGSMVANTEISNHVIYEPSSVHGASNSVPQGEFYFSSSEKLPNNAKDSNAWW